MAHRVSYVASFLVRETFSTYFSSPYVLLLPWLLQMAELPQEYVESGGSSGERC